MPLHRRFKCYVGLKSTEAKLKMLLRRYAFTTCAGVLGLEREERAVSNSGASARIGSSP
jgi:hypothetical protein